ncbi:helix-turn-helix domain-containing protein [Bdellovibrionota bacterium FG-2]
MENTEHVGYSGAAKITGMPVGTIYAKVSRKEIPHFRLGGRHVLFSVAELHAWLEGHRVTTITEITKQGGSHD